jgi:hypothetical protein
MQYLTKQKIGPFIHNMTFQFNKIHTNTLTLQYGLHPAVAVDQPSACFQQYSAVTEAHASPSFQMAGSLTFEGTAAAQAAPAMDAETFRDAISLPRPAHPAEPGCE